MINEIQELEDESQADYSSIFERISEIDDAD